MEVRELAVVELPSFQAPVSLTMELAVGTRVTVPGFRRPAAKSTFGSDQWQNLRVIWAWARGIRAISRHLREPRALSLRWQRDRDARAHRGFLR